MSNSLMSNVKIKKQKLLDAVTKNLEQHKSYVAEATQDRRNALLTYLAEELLLMTNSSDFQPEHLKHFPAPTDNSAEYEKAIAMIGMTEDEVIELDERQFDKLVMDNWGFKLDLMATRSFYGKS